MYSRTVSLLTTVGRMTVGANEHDSGKCIVLQHYLTAHTPMPIDRY